MNELIIFYVKENEIKLILIIITIIFILHLLNYCNKKFKYK